MMPLRNKRNNSPWGVPMVYSNGLPATPTEFERLVKHLGLNINDEASLIASPRLVSWIRRNVCKRYIPENILEALGEKNNAEWGALDARSG